MSYEEVTEWLCKSGLQPNQRKIERVFLSHPDKDRYNYLGAIDCGDKNVDGVKIRYSCSIANYRQVSLNVALWKVAQVKQIMKVSPPSVKVKIICNGHAKIVTLAAQMNDCRDKKRINEDSAERRVQHKVHSLTRRYSRYVTRQNGKDVSCRVSKFSNW